MTANTATPLTGQTTLSRDHARAPVLGDPGVRTRLRPVEEFEDGVPGDVERERLAATLGVLLKELRARYQVGTRALAERSAVARSTITRLEAGQRRARPVTLRALAFGLDHQEPGPIAEQLLDAAGESLRPDTPGGVRRQARRLRAARRTAGLVRLRIWRASEAARTSSFRLNIDVLAKLPLDVLDPGRSYTNAQLDRLDAQLARHMAVMDESGRAKRHSDYLREALKRCRHPLEIVRIW
jgi:transcriptional regulator with XRE-family HTH domain